MQVTLCSCHAFHTLHLSFRFLTLCASLAWLWLRSSFLGPAGAGIQGLVLLHMIYINDTCKPGGQSAQTVHIKKREVRMLTLVFSPFSRVMFLTDLLQQQKPLPA